mmetsp:Transcript_1211/g.3955  ORF Transcript_1211/g.3955 Transcript_1211/m.3955 type:complete len:211 (-) Transcript_1211:84-716(-)
MTSETQWSLADSSRERHDGDGRPHRARACGHKMHGRQNCALCTQRERRRWLDRGNTVASAALRTPEPGQHARAALFNAHCSRALAACRPVSRRSRTSARSHTAPWRASSGRTSRLRRRRSARSAPSDGVGEQCCTRGPPPGRQMTRGPSPARPSRRWPARTRRGQGCRCHGCSCAPPCRIRHSAGSAAAPRAGPAMALRTQALAWAPRTS